MSGPENLGLPDLRAYFSERMKNPLLAPFTIAWLVSNWRLVSVLLFSNLPIESRISFIDEHYLDTWHLLVAPLAFAFGFAMIVPWLSWGVQVLQDYPNLQRRKHKLDMDTQYLTASVKRAEAQAALNQILAKDEHTQRLQEESEVLKRQLAEQQGDAQAKIAAVEEELQSRRDEYEKLSGNDRAEADATIERLKIQLEEEIDRAESERRSVEAELQAREKELKQRIDRMDLNSVIRTDVDFEKLLTSKRYRLFHNPKIGPARSKIVTFNSDGAIAEGRNKNENSWRITDGKLEILQWDRIVHSRFYFLPTSRIFVHTGDKDTTSAPGQYIIPED